MKAFLSLLKAILSLASTRLGPVALAALVPFIASHLVVLQARRIGMPDRLVLDLVHGIIVLSYLTACVRVAQGRGRGLDLVGIAGPKPSWPGWSVIVRVTAAVIVIGLPVAVLLHPLIQAMETAQAGPGAGALYLPVTMLPEFVMTTLVGLALAAGTGKVAPMTIDVKICGINSADALDAAVHGGATMLGFVFFAKSPRVVSPDEARALLARVPDGVVTVALMVDPTDSEAKSIGAQLPFDMVQLHGSESVERVAELKAITGKPIMKAVGIASIDDIARAHAYEAVADRILLDAKPPKGADLPGGNALSFDWNLIANETWTKPWMLAGGLTADNLSEAVKISGTGAVDVSSGVEDAPGHKSVDKIRAFLDLATTL